MAGSTLEITTQTVVANATITQILSGGELMIAVPLSSTRKSASVIDVPNKVPRKTNFAAFLMILNPICQR